MLVCSVYYKWYIKQINAVTVFLNFTIKKIKVYMKLLNDYKRDGFVVLLYKILYGLK